MHHNGPQNLQANPTEVKTVLKVIVTVVSQITDDTFHELRYSSVTIIFQTSII